MTPRTNEYDIAFAGLKDGEHRFTFQVNEGFFELFTPLEAGKCDLKVEIDLTKSPSMLSLAFSWKGHVSFPCDRCLDEVSLPVKGKEILYVKFGSEAGEASEDILVVTPQEHKINVAQYIYEFITLSFPTKRAHARGKCNSEVIEKLHELEVAEKPEVDPRWTELKKLNIS